MNFNFKLWSVLLLIGIAGVASLLLSDIPLNLPPEVTSRFTADQLKLLILINPSILVILMTSIGIACFQKAGLEVPLLDKILNQRASTITVNDILKFGILLGIMAGIGIVSISKLFESQMPTELVTANKNLSLSVFSKILYGGITEEILLRFGLMSLVVWILTKLFKVLSSSHYWFAILLCAVIFGLGHLPMLKQLVPDPSLAMYTYIIFGNMFGGVLFGYAYWKKGLEAAFIAHAFAHLTMLAMETFSK